MNINGCVQFLINMLDTIVRWLIKLTKRLLGRISLKDAGEAQHSHHAADPLRASGGRPPRN